MFYEINGFRMNVQRNGAGPVIVMIHGNGEDHRTFDKLESELKSKFEIITYDARNHGKSDKGLKMTYELMADDLDALLEYFDLKNVCVIGFSDGGIVALHSSIRQNPRITKQILLGINLSTKAFLPEVLEELKLDYAHKKNDFVKLMLKQTPITPFMCKKVLIPTLLYYGEDEPFTQTSIQGVNRAIPNSKLQILKGHDHGSYISHSSFLKNDIVDFLSYKQID